VDFAQMVSQLGNCRYSECAFSLLAGHEILAFEGESDYQGSASVLARRTGAVEGFYEYIYVAWSWGSCSGCDQWEAQDLSADQIIEELRKSAGFFETLEQTIAFITPMTHYPTGDSYTRWLKGVVS